MGDLRLKMRDRTISPSWRANAIIEHKPKRRAWKKKKVNSTAEVEMSGCMQRCELEYFATKMVMFAGLYIID